jgi:hypothetical protein
MLVTRSCAVMIEANVRDEVFIAKGERIYRWLLPHAVVVNLAEIDLEPVNASTAAWESSP